ncbi:MAG: hypothetical protein JST54_26815 [Deltaproteobacteria bacterium]|nr:hypothetical protein [Deltaproteobacteria bacterium]
MTGLHPLGVFHGSGRLAPRLVLLGAAALGAVLDRLQLAWRDLESTTWWASNGRDVLLGFSALAQALALVGLGFPVAAAVLTAAQLTLVAALAESALLSRPWVRAHDAVAICVAVLFAVPLAVAPEQVFAWIESVAARFG